MRLRVVEPSKDEMQLREDALVGKREERVQLARGDALHVLVARLVAPLDRLEVVRQIDDKICKLQCTQRRPALMGANLTTFDIVAASLASRNLNCARMDA